MKIITLLAAVAVVSLVGPQPASAWHFEGCVLCAGGLQDPIADVGVLVEGIGGNYDGDRFFARTDDTGCVNIQLPDEPQDYKVSLLHLPPDTTVVSPLSGVHYFSLDDNKLSEKFDFKTNGPDCGECWLTGGGVKFETVTGDLAGQAGPKDSFGGNVFPSCSGEPGNGGNVNVVFHSRKLHLKNTDIESVVCGNVPGIEPGSESPVTPFNFLEWMGTGTIVGIKGNKDPEIPVYVFGRAEDRNEPGNQNAASGENIDRLFIRVFTNPANPVGSTVAIVDTNDGGPEIDPLLITGGNLQIHASSCDDPPALFPLF